MILRNAIAAVAILLFVVTAAVAVVAPPARPPACVLALLVAAILFENRRYRHRGDHPEGLNPTNEAFVDPETGRPTRVWSNSQGERRYLEE